MCELASSSLAALTQHLSTRSHEHQYCQLQSPPRSQLRPFQDRPYVPTHTRDCHADASCEPCITASTSTRSAKTT